MPFLRHSLLFSLLLPVTASAGPAQNQAGEALDQYAYGLQYILSYRPEPRFAAPPENPLRVDFASPFGGEIETIAVQRDGETIYDMEEVWIWANIKGTMIDAGRSEKEEESMRNLATVTGVAYKIKQPRLLVTEGSIQFHGRATIAGHQIECSEGGVILTNNNGRDREYDVDFSVEWQDGSLCSVGDEKFRRIVGVWGVERQNEAGATQATELPAGEQSMDQNELADEQGLARLRTYAVGETSFGTFQEDFGDYFTRQAVLNPTAVPGYILKPLHHEKTINLPPDKMDSASLVFGKSHVPDELIEYVTGIYVLGFMSQDTGTPTNYMRSPDSFSVIAALAFKDGVLTGMELADGVR